VDLCDFLRSDGGGGHQQRGLFRRASAANWALFGSWRGIKVFVLPLLTEGKLQAEQGLALAAEAGTVIVEIQDGAQKVVNAVGQFANQLST
jgi:hypothetical protein